MNRNQSRAGLWAVPFAFFALFFYWPIGKIMSIGFSGDWIARIATPKIASLLWFTIWQAAISSAFCLLFGIPGAYVLYRRRFRGQRILRSLITVPFMLPTIVVAIGFTAFKGLPLISPLLFGQTQIPIILCANVFMNYSLFVRIVGGVWATLDSGIEDAAALDGAGRLRTTVSVSLPQLAHAIASASILIFLYCAANFGLVLVLGGARTRTIETEIYVATAQNLDLPKAAGLVFLQSILTLFAFLVAVRISRSSAEIFATTTLEPRNKLDRRDLPAIVLTTIFICSLILLPMILIMARSFQFGSSVGLRNYSNLGGYGARDVLSITVAQAASNTVRNALITTILSMVIGITASYALSRHRSRSHSQSTTRFFDILFQLPVGISSVVLGFGYLVSFNGGIFPLRSSWLVTPVVQTLFSIPLVIRMVLPALSSVGSDLLESAETEAATPGQIWWLIEMPIIRNVLLVSTGYAAIISIGEFGAANFLAYGDQGTLPTVLYQLISRPGQENYGMAMASSALLILIALFIVSAVQLFEGSENR